MPSQKLLLKALCIMLTSLIFFRADAQQDNSKANKGKLLMNIPKPKPAPVHPAPHPTSLHAPYRTFDGTNNNIVNDQTVLYGSAVIPLFREMPAAYGSTDPNNAMAGANRPSARAISNAVSDEPVTIFNNRNMSTFFYVWGQFIDHDMSLTPTDTIEYVPVPLPVDEKIFTIEIPFTRSQVFPGTGKSTPRQQINLNTSWLDASQVYGSDSVRARWLRTFKNGKMKTSAGNLPPFNTLTGEYGSPIDLNSPDMANDSNKTVKTFVAGDIRASEHPGLISLHTLFIREHNKICDRLLSEGIKNDEEIYQKARKEVGAIIQAITYQEFLPAFGVKLDPYKGYQPAVRPDIANTFATGAYRFGHSVVADDIIMLDNNCDSIAPNVIELVDAFWTPLLVPKYNIEPFLKGFAAHTQYETDTKINSVLRNFLFVSPNDPVRFGIDLASLNIQRGRDHGLPAYNALRKFYTGKAASSFADITKNAALAASLQSLYGSVDNVDLWVGVLAEDHIPNASAGNLLVKMLKSQFERLRDGDYYFYLSDPFLSESARSRVKNTTLSSLIKRNTALTNLQSNVFFVQNCPTVPTKDTVTKGNKGNVAVILFPNPATNFITITSGTAVPNSRVNIYSVTGVLVKTATIPTGQKSVTIDVSGLKSGTYFANVSGQRGAVTIKFVKL